MSDRDPELYHPEGDAADGVLERMREFDGPYVLPDEFPDDDGQCDYTAEDLVT